MMHRAADRITRVHCMRNLTHVLTVAESSKGAWTRLTEEHFPFLSFTRPAARGVTSRGKANLTAEVTLSSTEGRRGTRRRDDLNGSTNGSDRIEDTKLHETAFLAGRRLGQCHPMHTFFSLPTWMIPLLPASCYNASHYSSFALVSFARTCQLPSIRRSFVAGADDDDDGFPVRAFLRVRTSRRLPRPSADLRQCSLLTVGKLTANYRANKGYRNF